jgi:hypothetical protein
MALAKAVPDAELLDEYVRRYPEHAAALTDFAIELAFDSAVDSDGADAPPEPEQSSSSLSVSNAMSRFHNRLYAIQHEVSGRRRDTIEAITNPFASLGRAELRAIGHRLNVSNVFMMKLRDRQIHHATIPSNFQCRVAEEVRIPVDVLIAHLAGQAQVSAGMHFKADRKPVAGAKQTFEEAVRSSGLTSAQQAELLGL